ncbi:lipoprotein [Streptomyces sp. NPDC090022]|uniref:lipoprotein n=1 Tax=Streptomyces sp. NPDC090022 TaxID=3365920 RepID=UPI0037FDC11F
MRRTVIVRLLTVAALAGLVTSCGPSGTETGAEPGDKPAAGATSDSAPAAPSAASVGAPGTDCPLPVSFGLATSWQPKAVPGGIPHGAFTLRCEIDAKPAGHIGFLRVWTAEKSPGTARQALDAFLAKQKVTGTPAVTDVTAGALPAAEAAYETTALDEPKQEHAFAVVTPSGAAVVVHLGGLDTDEHKAMLPAYQLARQSLKALP